MKMKCFIFVCLFLLPLVGCSWMDTKAYYATHPTSVESVEAQWGAPLRIEPLEDGTVKWVYFVDDGILHDEIYYLIRNGRVVDFGKN